MSIFQVRFINEQSLRCVKLGSLRLVSWFDYSLVRQLVYRLDFKLVSQLVYNPELSLFT